MKLHHDKKEATKRSYEIRQWAWLSMKIISLRHPIHRGKMVSVFIGPVKVRKMVGPNAVSLDVPANLKAYCADQTLFQTSKPADSSH